jgi:Mce-associated membrane protein
MTTDSATVLVAVTTKGSNTANNMADPRSWRLRIELTREADQIKLAKVEFVP